MKAKYVSNVKDLPNLDKEPISLGIKLPILLFFKIRVRSSVNKAISAGILPPRLLLIKLRFPVENHNTNESESRVNYTKTKTKKKNLQKSSKVQEKDLQTRSLLHFMIPYQVHSSDPDNHPLLFVQEVVSPLVE